MKELAGKICENGLIKELLMMTESLDISYDTDLSYNLEDIGIKDYLNGAGVNGNPLYVLENYEKELSKYIVLPIINNDIEFKFIIDSLKAKEKKWVGPALLISPLADSFDIEYSIKSKHSDGNLSGKITYSM